MRRITKRDDFRIKQKRITRIELSEDRFKDSNHKSATNRRSKEGLLNEVDDEEEGTVRFDFFLKQKTKRKLSSRYTVGFTWTWALNTRNMRGMKSQKYPSLVALYLVFQN